MSGRSKKGMSSRVFLVAIWMACFGLTANDAATASECADSLQGNLAENFGIALESVELSARTSVRSENGETLCTVPAPRLTLSLRYEVCDHHKPVAVDTNPATILGVFDDVGRPLACQTDSAVGMRRYKEVGWEDEWESEDMRMDARLLPSGLVIDLVLDSNQPVPSSLSRVEGYIYVLYAGAIIEADVAYEIDAEWVHAEGDLHIEVCPETPPKPGPIEYEAIPGVPRGWRPNAPIALWQYKTRVYSDTSRVYPLGQLWISGPSVEDYVVIRTELIATRAAVTIIAEVPSQSTSFGYHNDCSCAGTMRQDQSDYHHIRHVIGVAPVELKVPFVLTDIPIPSFQVTGNEEGAH